VLVEGDDGAALLTAEVDLKQAAEIRRRIPAFQDRRPDLYTPPDRDPQG
jgi:predicted amidohydrolase